MELAEKVVLVEELLQAPPPVAKPAAPPLLVAELLQAPPPVAPPPVAPQPVALPVSPRRPSALRLQPSRRSAALPSYSRDGRCDCAGVRAPSPAASAPHVTPTRPPPPPVLALCRSDHCGGVRPPAAMARGRRRALCLARSRGSRRSDGCRRGGPSPHRHAVLMRSKNCAWPPQQAASEGAKEASEGAKEASEAVWIAGALAIEASLRWVRRLP